MTYKSYLYYYRLITVYKTMYNTNTLPASWRYELEAPYDWTWNPSFLKIIEICIECDGN